VGECGRDTGFWWGEIPRWVWCGRVWERYRVLVGRDTEMGVVWASVGEILLERCRLRWEDDIKMDLQEVGLI